MVIKKKLSKVKFIEHIVILCLTLLMWLGTAYIVCITDYSKPLLHGLNIYEIIVVMFLISHGLLSLVLLWACVSIPKRKGE